MSMRYTSEAYYEEAFMKEWQYSHEELIEACLRDKSVGGYRIKTIRSGKMLECEIYPIWSNQKVAHRAKKTCATPNSQKDQNDKNSKKYLIRIINTNFTEKRGTWATVTYKEGKLPETREKAWRNLENYIRRLKYDNERRGREPCMGEEFKAVFVVEYEDDPLVGEKRVHNHIITNYKDRDRMEDLWHGGGRSNTRRLQPDDFGLEGLARYVGKDPRGTKRYRYTKNLKKPTITIADRKITRGRVNRIAANENAAPETFAKMYPGYTFNDIKIKYSDLCAGVYLYVRMRKDEERRDGRKKVDNYYTPTAPCDKKQSEGKRCKKKMA